MAMTKHGNNGKHTPKFQNSAKFQSVLDEKAPFMFVEAYKTLRTNLDFASSASRAQSILVTSALPEESKSTTSINLALTLAGSGHSVVIVECDLRKPTLRRYLTLERGTKGLSALLSGGATLEECLLKAEDLGISVIHAGTIPPNPSELLNQERMRELIQTLKQHFDYVILDAPPVTVVTDAAVVGRMADGALLVIRSKYASTKTVRQAKQRLEAVNVKILGAVLTRFSVKKSGWRSGYYYGDKYGYGQTRKAK